MYNYPAGATGLDASMPPWVLDGGYTELYKRIKDPETCKKIIEEIHTPTDKWENLYLAAGSPDRLILVGFKNDKLKPLTGKTLGEVARMRGTDPETTILDLVLEDQSRVGTVYFLMDEENIKKQIKIPWVSFGSDVEPVKEMTLFLLALLLGSVGFSITFTFVSAISAKADNNATLMAILAFPLVIPILMTVLKLTAGALWLLRDTSVNNDMFILLGIDLLLLAMALVLYPFLWRD